jgi:hypothetical protein
LKKADFLFGNETEAAAFAKSEGWEETDVSEIAVKISEMGGPEKTLTVVWLLHIIVFELCSIANRCTIWA